MPFPVRQSRLPLLACLSIVCAPSAASSFDHVAFAYGGREVLVHAPAQLPATGTRALVVVLHGGLGNASRIANGQSESGLNLDALAERNGFVVAYLNGTPVTRDPTRPLFGWNAGGGCCGQSAENRIDDVAYITGAVADLVRRYGIDPKRVYGTGHSNGAMMAQRMVCKTRVLTAVVTVSGPLNLEAGARCPAASGARILAIHGADDQNVPVAGGVGAKGLSRVAFRSEAEAQTRFTTADASYTLDIVPGADHALAHVDEALVKNEGMALGEKTVKFFGLVRQ